jgi:hypothetical protein
MELIRSSYKGWAIIGGLVVSLNFVHAQTTAQIVQSTSANDTGIMSVVAQARALAAEEPVLEQSIPIMAVGPSAEYPPGTYWGMQGTWPPFPFNPFPELPVYVIDPTNRVFLVDDRSVDFAGLQAQQEEQAQSMAMTANLMGVPPMPGDGGGEGTNTYTLNGFGSAVDYGTNLWIAQVGIVSNNLVGMLSNSSPDISYEIQTRTNLAQGDWNSEGFILGSETTNWTPLSVVQGGRTNLFVRIRSWEDDGSGLPIWWQLQYFGTTGVDPYGDPDGDGWNNLQEFQNRTDPLGFYLPPAPEGLTVSYNPNTSVATVNWLASPGLVTGYTLQRSDNSYFNLSVNATSYQDTVPSGAIYYNPVYFGPTFYARYRIQAQYASGSSAWSDWVALEPSYSGNLIDAYYLPVYLLAGPQGSACLLVSALPPGTTAIRLTRLDADYGDSTFVTNFDISVSLFTNGLYSMPSSWLKNPVNEYNNAYYCWWAQVVNSNGGCSAAKLLTDGYILNQTNAWIVPPFFDGRTQLKQNLIFQLRAALVDQPFQFKVFYPNQTTTTIYPANYAYSGFYQYDNDNIGVFNALLPFVDNYSYRNFVFSVSDLNPDGLLYSVTNFIDDDFNYHSGLIGPPAYYFQLPTNATNHTPILSLLDTNTARWLDIGLSCNFSYDPYNDIFWFENFWEIAMELNHGTKMIKMGNNYTNLHGLSFISTIIATGNTIPEIKTYYPGEGPTNDVFTNLGWMYSEVAQPNFQDDGYYFGSSSSLPGSNSFSITNTSDLIIIPVGGLKNIAGYAKLTVLNGFTGTYGYLGQYFDQAYKIDNDNVTTNTTGLLSPYGQFFATEPGPAALVTMPDVDTGARGTCTVHCVSLVLDKSHDLVMDKSFNGPDATSQASPDIVWVNNGYIKPGNNGSLDQDLPLPMNDPMNANCAQGEITCQRDLENFFRLWICGVPQLPVGQGYAVTLSMSPVSGNPAVNLYYSCETNGGTGYLTDTNIAATQTGSAYYDRALCTISNNQSCTLQLDSYGNLLYTHYLFEGAGIGEGQLTMTISQNGNTIAQSSVWLDLRDVKSLYQRVKVTPRDPNGIPAPFDSATTTFDENTAGVDMTSDSYGFSPPSDESKTATVFVHGSNLSVPNALSNGDTMFKRLYWQGYRGRFVLFYWNTLVGPWDGAIPAHYNYNEYRSFKYGQALKHYVETNLPAGYAKNVIGHSMGNMVVVSALYPRGSTPGMTCRNVIFMQAALPASCLDPNAATLPALANLESPQTTPDNFTNQWGYRGLLATNVNATLYNIYNANDYALGWWINNQELCKPENLGYPIPREVGTRYTWDSGTQLGVLYYANGFLHRTVGDPQESMSFIARSRTEALGRVATGGSIGQNQNVGAGTTFDVPFGDARTDHSGEFTRPIQQLNSFYNYLYLRVR